MSTSGWTKSHSSQYPDEIPRLEVTGMIGWAKPPHSELAYRIALRSWSLLPERTRYPIRRGLRLYCATNCPMNSVTASSSADPRCDSDVEGSTLEVLGRPQAC